MFENFKRLVGGVHFIVLAFSYFFYFVASVPDIFSESLVRESPYIVEEITNVILATSLFGMVTALAAFIRRDLSNYTLILLAKAMFGILTWFLFLEKYANKETISLLFGTLFT
jgi:hypothetical protein